MATLVKYFLKAAAALVLLALLSACAGSKDQKLDDLLDAADLFGVHHDFLESVRAEFPGPYTEFKRIPNRDPAARGKQDAQFIKRFRKHMPLEFVDFFPMRVMQGDEMDIILRKYQKHGNQHSVGLIYFSAPFIAGNQQPHYQVFDSCDYQVRRWVRTATSRKAEFGPTPVIAMCKLNKNWFSYHRVD